MNLYAALHGRSLKSKLPMVAKSNRMQRSLSKLLGSAAFQGASLVKRVLLPHQPCLRSHP